MVKQHKTRLVLALLAFALIVLFSMFGCKSKSEKPAQLDSIPAPVHDTLLLAQDTAYVEVPAPYEVIKDSIVYVEAKVDTAAILKMFNEKKTYKDTLRFDYGFITLTDTIMGNSIVSRTFLPKVKVPVKEKIRIVQEEPKSALYLGINGGLDKPNYVYTLGTSMLYLSPGNKMIYEIGIGVRNKTMDGTYGEFIPYIHGGAYWKINLNKKK